MGNGVTGTSKDPLSAFEAGYDLINPSQQRLVAFAESWKGIDHQLHRILMLRFLRTSGAKTAETGLERYPLVRLAPKLVRVGHCFQSAVMNGRFFYI